MSRFSKIIADATKSPKPGLEGEGAVSTNEAPLSPTEVVAAKPEDGEGAKGKDEGQPDSPTEVVAAKPEDGEGTKGKDEGQPASPTEVVAATPETTDKDEPEAVSMEGLDFFNKVKRLENKLARLDKQESETKEFLEDAKKGLKQAEADLSKADSEGAKKKLIKKIAAFKEDIDELEFDLEDIKKIRAQTKAALEKAKGNKASNESDDTTVDGAAADATETGDVAAVQEVTTTVGEVETDPTQQEELGEVTFEDDEQVLADVVTADAELDKGNDAMDTMQDAASRLGVVETRLEDSLAEGGLDPVAAGFMQDNVDNIAERLEEDEVVYPAVESFGGESMRYASTVASLEAVKEFAGRVGAGIKAVYEQVKAFLKGLVAKLVQYFGTVKMRNEELKKRLGATGPRTVSGNDTIDIGALLGRVAIGDSPSLEGFAKLPTLLDDSRTFDSGLDEALKSDLEILEELATKPNSLEMNLDKWVRAYDAQHRGALIPKAFHNEGKSSSGSAQYKTDVLPGNVVLSITRNRFAQGTSAAEKLQALFGIQSRFERLQEGDGNLSGEAKVLTIDEMKKVATITDGILAAGGKITQQANIDKLGLKEIVVSKDVGPEQAGIVKHLLNRYSSRLSQAHQVSAKTLTYAARAAASFQSYAFKSLETYA